MCFKWIQNLNEIIGGLYTHEFGNYLILFNFQILYSNSKNNVIYKFSQKNSDSDNYWKTKRVR